jgi:Leucine-rich repeat (LRR) protein
MKVGSVLIVLGTVTVLSSSPVFATEPVVASAAVTPQAQPIPSALQGAWVIDTDATTENVKKSPKWKAEDEAGLSMMIKMFSSMQMEIGTDSVTMIHSVKKHTQKVTVKSHAGKTTELTAITTEKGKTQEVTLTLVQDEKGRLNVRSSRSDDSDYLVWKQRPADWKPASGEEALATLVTQVFTNALNSALSKDTKNTAVKPAVPSQPPKVSSKPPFEEYPWGGNNFFKINDSMDQAGFVAFCETHPDVEGLRIDDTKNIASLEGISKLTRLKSLTLHSMTPQASREMRLDLTPLAGLTALTKLDCHATRVSNTGALKGLKKLKTLSFYMSDVESIECVKELPALEELNLYGSGHSFPNYEPLAGSKLKKLDVYMNKQATDENLKVLGTIQSLEKFDAALTSFFSTIEFLRNQPNLRGVDLWNDPISDISPLAGKKKLEWLRLWDTKVTDLSALSGADSLSYLNLEGTAVKDISPLAGKKKMDELNLKGTKVTDISALSDAESLYSLDLQGTLIKDITPLLGLKNLRDLKLPLTVPADQVEKLKAANPSVRIKVEAPRK